MNILYTYNKYNLDLVLQTKKLVDPTIEHLDYCTAPSPRPEYIISAFVYNPTISYDFDGKYGLPDRIVKAMSIQEYADVYKNFMNEIPYQSVWVDTNCDGTKDALSRGSQLTISKNLSFTETKTIYVGIFGDNQFEINVDGTKILHTVTVDTTRNFIYLHVFPITVDSGQHLFSFTGTGDGSVNDSLGVIVWDNPIEDLLLPIPRSQWNVLYSSYDSISEGVDIVTCPIDYSYENSIGKCVQITSIDQITVDDLALFTPILNSIAPESITSWVMDFGDTFSDSGTGTPPDSFEHQYASPGTYQIKFTVILNSELPVQFIGNIVID